MKRPNAHQCIAKSQGWTLEHGLQFAISFGPGLSVPRETIAGYAHIVMGSTN